MEVIDKVDPKARAWFTDIGEQSRWSKHASDPLVCCDKNKTNFVESFNATLGVKRCKLVLTLLEGEKLTLTTSVTITL